MAKYERANLHFKLLCSLLLLKLLNGSFVHT